MMHQFSRNRLRQLIVAADAEGSNLWCLSTCNLEGPVETQWRFSDLDSCLHTLCPCRYLISLIGADENGGHLSPRSFIGPVANSLLLYVLLSLNCLKRGDRWQDWWLSLAGAVKERKRKGKYGGGEAELWRHDLHPRAQL